MARFKPQVSYITKNSLRDYYNEMTFGGRGKLRKGITKEYNTYKELKKDLKEICENNIDADGVFVVRSKRGQWGEWNERWDLDSNGNPTIIKEGWS